MSPNTVNSPSQPDDDHIEKSSRVYIAIRDNIYARRWSSETQINLQVIADELKVSRTPVREALIRLSVEHLVQLRPGKGFFVRQRLWQEDLHDLEVLFILLKGMVEKSIHHFSGEGLFHSVQRHTEDRAADIPLQVMFIESIYDRIIAPSGNVTATRLSRALTARTTFSRARIMENFDSRRAIIACFRQLVIELESKNLGVSVNQLQEIFFIKESVLRLYDQPASIFSGSSPD